MSADELLATQSAHTQAVAALLTRLTPRELIIVLTVWRDRQSFCAEHAPAVDQALAELGLALNVEDAARELAALPPAREVVGRLLARAWPGEANGAANAGSFMCAPARLEDGEQGAVAAFTTQVSKAGLIAFPFRYDPGIDGWRPEGAHAWTREIGSADVKEIDLPPCFTPTQNLTALLHRTRDTGREQVWTGGVGHTSV